jgi:hypothetical protein
MIMWDRFVPFRLPGVSAVSPPAETDPEIEAASCGQCGHRMVWHVMVMTGATPMDGAVIVCPCCPCSLTWAPPGNMLPGRPPAHVLAHLRTMLFGMQ